MKLPIDIATYIELRLQTNKKGGEAWNSLFDLRHHTEKAILYTHVYGWTVRYVARSIINGKLLGTMEFNTNDNDINQ